MSQTQTFHVRWMMRKDMPDVLLIGEGSPESAWPEDEFLRVLRQRDCVGMVAEDPEGRVVGFMVYRLAKQSIRLLNFAVASDRRRQGVGTAMMAKMRNKLGVIRSRILIDVCERNLAFQCFLRDCGVPAVSISSALDTDDIYQFECRLLPVTSNEGELA